MLLAERYADAGVFPEIVCTILLVATVIAILVGLLNAVGVDVFRRAGGGRWDALVVGVVLMIVYIICC